VAWSSNFPQIGRLSQSLADLVDPGSGLCVRCRQPEGRRRRFLSVQRNLAEARVLTRRTISGLTVGLMLAATAFGTPKSAQERQPVSGRQITIRIRDYAQAHPLVRQHAEEAAGNILQEAGVATHWIDCPVGSSSSGDCSSPVSPLDFVVNLLPYSMSDLLHQGGGVLGFALEANSKKDFGFIASVFYDVVKERAAEHQQDLGELLGDAIAHELGHLLLGTHSHSGWGLMSAFWSGNQLRRAAQGCLAFSDREAERIQAALRARTLAATARRAVSESSRVVPTGEAYSARVEHLGGGTQ
jgi:hypothetical protein